MRSIWKSGIATLVMICSAQPVQAADAPWAAHLATDALTDASVREACAERAEFKLCFTFEPEGVWATVVSTGSAVFDAELFPAFRVDQNDAIESVNPAVISLERTLRSRLFPRRWEPKHLSWRAQVPSKSGRWEAKPPVLIGEMINGRSMLVRVYLAGGYQRDIIFPLAGFCKAAAAVYAADTPPLQCGSDL